MPRLSSEAREQRRQALIEAGWRCLTTKSFRQLTMDDICAEAGLPSRSFQSCFGDMRDLLLALVSVDSRLADEALLALTVSKHSGPKSIEQFLRELVRVADEPGRNQLRANLWAEAATDDDVRAALTVGLRRRREVLAAWLADAARAGDLRYLPPNAFAAVVLALADGLMVHAALDPGGFRWNNIRRAVAVLLQPIEP